MMTPPSWLPTAIVGALVMAVHAYLWKTEGSLATFALTLSVLAAVALLVAALTRSLAAGAGMAASVVLFYAVAGQWVSDATGRLLHAYDVAEALRSREVLGALAGKHPGRAAVLVAILSVAIGFAALAWRRGWLGVSRSAALAGAVVSCVIAAATSVAMAERPHTLYYFWNIHLSSFLKSVPETIGVLTRGHALEAAATSSEALPSHSAPCAAGEQRAHVILIHQESVAPPSLFPALGYDRRLDSFFRSVDGQTRLLGVETYGGASWLSEFSVMTGLSARSFGSIKQMVQPILAGKVRDTLPQVLTQCGYRPVLYYPMLPAYLGAGRFFGSIGFTEIRDAKSQGAKRHDERDHFYYRSFLGDLERHLARSPAPMFAFIETSSAHWPYTFTYDPEVNVPGGAVGTPPEMHEYLRRLALASADYRELKAELARRFPAERFVIVHYGDHQPTATRTLLGFPEHADIEDIVRAAPALAFQTYVAFDAVNYALPALPAPPLLDIPFVPTLILEAARVPLPPSHAERRRLLDRCGGRYFHCVWRDEILRFHRRLIDARIVAPM
jgi:hypothetical protein